MDWYLERDYKDDITIKPLTVREGSAKRGGISELFACAHLIRLGYEVFRNVIANGPIDLIAVKENKIIYIDVKTFTPYIKTDGSLGFADGNQLTDRQKELGVKLLFVTYDGECSFRKTNLVKHYAKKIEKITCIKNNKNPEKEADFNEKKLKRKNRILERLNKKKESKKIKRKLPTYKPEVWICRNRKPKTIND
jgi:hypothetical protein